MKPYISTPQASEASILTKTIDNLDSLSPEKSFNVPARGADLICQMRSAKGRGMNLKTPRTGGRDPLRLLPNDNQGRSEFTPLMRSVTKNNIARRLSSKKPGAAYTPRLSLLNPGDLSTFDPENTSSSAGNLADDTPVPHQASSAQSTPLAQLPTRDGGGLVSDGNMMTLREQENIIDKIEKENFGLKMKIHFLEEALSKRGGEFNQAALKENTDLKVNRITMQRELHKFKKNIAQAEKDAEVYRLQLEEFKERIRRKQVDESVRIELHKLRSEVEAKDQKLKKMERESSQTSHDDQSQIQKLKDEVDDLQADLREKDRLIDERDDQIDSLKAEVSKDSNEVVEVEEELRYAKEEVEELKQNLDRVKTELQEAKEDRQEAIDDKRRAEEDLDELRDEMANKSFNTKGLSRQLEEKANKLEDDFQDLQQRYEALQADLASKSDAEKQLRDRVRELEKEGASEARRSHQDLELSQQQRETLERKLNNMAKQLETTERDLQDKTDEKELLQSRHDALTKESAELQKDLSRSQKAVRELEKSLEEERQQSALNDNLLRTNHKHELDLLNEQIDGLHREVNSKENAHAADLEEWVAQRHSLESASQKAEEKAKGLQRTLDKLQDAQGTLSGREMKLQEALESENERHRQEEKILSKEIQELQQDLTAKRQAADESRIELNNAKEELRISIREQALLKEKVVELEDEIEILQADIEQEHEIAQMQQQKSSSHSDAQVQKLRQEKQSLQEQLTTVNLELKEARSTLKSGERDREELEKRLEKVQKSSDDTFNIDQEKRDLKRTKIKLEKEIVRLTSERDSLAQANNVLEEEINTEMDRANEEENRLNAEIESLRNRKASGADLKDRELTSARNKITRLENRVKDLEEMIDNHSKVISPSADMSELRHDLTEARDTVTLHAKRESELKASNRDLKMRVNDLEKDLHEARLSQYKAKSPSASPPPSHSKELAQIRQNLIDAQSEIKVLSSENRELKHAARRSSSNETELVELQSAARSRLDEVESLNKRLSEQNKIVDDLREKLELLQEEQDGNEDLAASIRKRDRQIQDLRQQVKHLRDGQVELNDVSIRLSARGGEAQEMKRELRRLREERGLAKKRADEIGTELDALQSKYEGILEKLSSGKLSSKDDVREKEMRGLIKEIMWLKAKCKREERLRRDLAWSKEFLKQGEVMRSQCNQVDLRILGEMGVSLEQRKYESKLRPVQKFRAGVFAVIAAIRMSNMEESWRDAKLMGEELRLMRAKQTKSRTRVRILEV